VSDPAAATADREVCTRRPATEAEEAAEEPPRAMSACRDAPVTVTMVAVAAVLAVDVRSAVVTVCTVQVAAATDVSSRDAVVVTVTAQVADATRVIVQSTAPPPDEDVCADRNVARSRPATVVATASVEACRFGHAPTDATAMAWTAATAPRTGTAARDAAVTTDTAMVTGRRCVIRFPDDTVTAVTDVEVWPVAVRLRPATPVTVAEESPPRRRSAIRSAVVATTPEAEA
jgi:hypothetical protein